MTEIVNNNKLELILTQYGLGRIAEAHADPSINLHLTKIKFGSGKNYEYYKPAENQSALKGPIPEAEFYVYRKELLEDGLTISFFTTIPENTGGFDIREVGLYEDINGEDKLFAIGTCQPFVKPRTADNYFIAVDYYIFLKAANFASIYDQITLDVEHALVTVADMEEMMRTFLFSNSNLIKQIENNSQIIGYNRATQLYEKITENKTNYGYMTLYKNYTSLIDMCSEDDIFSFWAFDYSRRPKGQAGIVDLSLNSNFLSTTAPVNSLNKVTLGFMSLFTFTPNINFSLNASIPVQLFDAQANLDIPFTMAFALEPLEYNVSRTLIAKSNYSTEAHTFEFKELNDGSIQIKLFSDSDNYITFTSNTKVIPESRHSLVLSYNNIKREFIGYLNAQEIQFTKEMTGTYIHMNELPGTLYCFQCIPKFYICADNSTSPTKLLNTDASPYQGDTWSILNNKVYYDGHEASYLQEVQPDTLYAWKYTDSEDIEHFIYTKVPPASSSTLSEVNARLYNPDYTWYEGRDWTVSGNVVLYRNRSGAEYDETQNINNTIYEWEYVAPAVYIYTNNNVNPKSLYSAENGANPELYTGNDWTISNQEIFYLGQETTYQSNKNISNSYPDLTSYIIGTEGDLQDPINSNVGIISIIKKELTKEQTKALSLLLCSTMGMNPYIIGN